MFSAHRSLALALFSLAPYGFGQAVVPSPQTPAADTPAQVQAKVEIPTDPAALLALAAKMNGLQNVPGPWHLKATYEVMDDKGAVKETGTIEEYWVSDKKYKKSYSSSSFHQTDYSTEKGVFREGNPDWPTQATALVERSLFPQFPTQRQVAGEKVSLKDEQINGAPFSCVLMNPSTGKDNTPNEVHCFDKQALSQRIGTQLEGAYHVVYNDVRIFDGVHIAASTGVSIVGKPFLGVHIERLEPLSAIDEEAFDPPPNVIPVSRRISLARNEMEIASPPPNPGLSSLRGIPPDFQGTVVLRMAIDKDGRIQDLEPLNLPDKRLRPAIDFMRQETFKPYKKDGEAVGVEILTIVRFESTPRYIGTHWKGDASASAP